MKRAALTLAFNVGREHRPHDPEWSTWAPLEKGTTKFAVPSGFAQLRLVDSAAPQDFGLYAARVFTDEGVEKLARNDPAGEWHVAVRDVLTGASRVCTVSVAAMGEGAP